MATWEDLWYFYCKLRPNPNLSPLAQRNRVIQQLCQMHSNAACVNLHAKEGQRPHHLTQSWPWHCFSLIRWKLVFSSATYSCLQGRGGTRTCTNTSSSTSTGSGSCGDPAGLEISSRVEWSKRRDRNLELTRWVVVEKDGNGVVESRMKESSMVLWPMQTLANMSTEENESQGTEVPLVQVYFVRSLYTAHIWDMWSDKLCNIDSLFQS